MTYAHDNGRIGGGKLWGGSHAPGREKGRRTSRFGALFSLPTAGLSLCAIRAGRHEECRLGGCVPEEIDGAMELRIDP
jgi:hypothetical protein